MVGWQRGLWDQRPGAGTPLEESSLVALGRSRKPGLQRWQRLLERGGVTPVSDPFAVRSEVPCLGRRGGSWEPEIRILSGGESPGLADLQRNSGL